MLKPGDLVARRYRVEALLGQGGMGAVYWARDEALQRSVALKVVRVEDGGTAGDQAIARLIREARAAAALTHPNVVAIHDVGEESEGSNGPQAFIAMELVEGKTLRTILDDGKKVDAKKKLRWLVEVARALAAAHKLGIVHRDVKPENVMVRDDGVVKVLDFGIARREQRPIDPTGATETPEEDAALATITAEGMAIGTPRYMAPEQLRSKRVDARADQFAWGVLAWELFAERPAWSAIDAIQLVLEIAEEDPPPLASVAGDLPEGVEAVVRRAMAKKPEDRFASMNDLVDALESASERKATSVSAEVVASPPSPPKKRASRLSIAAGSVFALAAIVLFMIFIGAPILSAYRGPHSAASSPSVSTSASAKAIAVTDLPAPATSNKEALAAWERAMQAHRDGSVNEMFEQLERAVAADSSLAAAELRLAIASGLPTERSKHYQRAAAERKNLSDRDRAFLDAVTPCLVAQPFDYPTCIERLRAMTAERSEDADLFLWLASAEQSAGDVDPAIADATRAMAIDPLFSPAYSTKAELEASRGDLDAAFKTLDACKAAIATSMGCRSVRLDLLKQTGQCEALEHEAREVLALRPDDRTGLAALASAEVALGKPIESVRSASERAASRLPEEYQKLGRAFDRLSIDLYVLDLDKSAADLDALAALVASDPTQRFHAVVAMQRIGIDVQLQKLPDAAKVASTWLKERDAYLPPPSQDVDALAIDYEPLFYFTEMRGGMISRDAFRAERDAWIARWEPKLKPAHRSFLWIYGYAAFVETPEDAAEALTILPRFGGVPRYREGHFVDSFIGRTYLLGGKIDDAIAVLEDATRACSAYDQPLATLRAYDFLGEAYEKKGDKDKACASYRAALSRWPSAKPKSKTLDDVKRRAQALGCTLERGSER